MLSNDMKRQRRERRDSAVQLEPVRLTDPHRVLKACQRAQLRDATRTSDKFPLRTDTHDFFIPCESKFGVDDGTYNDHGVHKCLKALLSCADKTGRIDVEAVDATICRYFRKIPFHEWLDVCFGTRSSAVDSLLMAVSLLPVMLRQHGYRLHRSTSTPTAALHPLTQCASQNPSEMQVPLELLESLLGPVFEVACDRNATNRFLRLMILSLRYEQMYILPEMVDWRNQLSKDFTFCEALMHESPSTLAFAITQADVEMFRQTDLEDLRLSTRTACDERWSWLEEQAYECASVSPALTTSLRHLAKVCLAGDKADWKELKSHGNYHSMTAIISGAYKAKRCASSSDAVDAVPHLFEDLERFVEPTNDFEYFRRRSTEDEALPWLAPFRQHLQSALARNAHAQAISCSANLLLQIMAYTEHKPEKVVPQQAGSVAEPLKIVVLGDAKVGKSTWVAQLCLGSLPTNRNVHLQQNYLYPYPSVKHQRQVHLVDCGGEDALGNVLLPHWSCLGDGFVIAYSVTSRRTFDRIPHLLRAIKHNRKQVQTHSLTHSHSSSMSSATSSFSSQSSQSSSSTLSHHPPILLLGCKADGSRRKVSIREGEELALKHGWQFAESSALSGTFAKSRSALDALVACRLQRLAATLNMDMRH